MTIEFERHNDSTTIANLEGRIDSANSQAFQSALESRLGHGADQRALTSTRRCLEQLEEAGRSRWRT